MAKVIRQFDGVPDGEGVVRTFKVGDTVAAGTDLERVAIEQGWCAKKKPPVKNKARQTLKNKSGVASQAAPRSRKKTSKKSKK